jgi:hypothetical protein
MLASSSLSLAAVGLRTQLKDATGIPLNQLIIGHPQVATKEQEEHLDQHYVNLFFYQVEFGAYQTDGTSDDPVYLRAHCLVTALGGRSSSDDPSPGETELKLMGAIIAKLHSHPTLVLFEDNQNPPPDQFPVAQLQIVPTNLSLDDINHLWATQGSVPYRLSVAFELALLPVPLLQRSEKSPRVTTLGEIIQVDLIPPDLPSEGFGLSGRSPRVPHVQVDVRRADWTPHICLLDENGDAVYTLSLQFGLGINNIRVIALGEQGTQVDLQWEIWERDGDRIWKSGIEGGSLTVNSTTLEPYEPKEELENIAVEVTMPFFKPGQALLRARRLWQGSILDSNALLVTLE